MVKVNYISFFKLGKSEMVGLGAEFFNGVSRG